MKRTRRGSAWKSREKKRSPVPSLQTFEAAGRAEGARAGLAGEHPLLSGDQYCGVLQSGEVGSEEAIYDWQQQGVFNHIAPTVDARLARLSKVRPALSVRAFSDSPEDMKTARLCSNILKAVKGRLDLDRIIARATLWSEVCGTAFTRSCGTAAGTARAERAPYAKGM